MYAYFISSLAGATFILNIAKQKITDLYEDFKK